MSAYEIRLLGHLDSSWSDWFEGFTLTNHPGGFTTLTGPIVDQAALHGLLRRVGDLGVTLISINALEEDPIAPRSSPPHTGGERAMTARTTVTRRPIAPRPARPECG